MNTTKFRSRIWVFTLLFAVMLFAFGAYAQHKRPDPTERAKKQTEWMKTELNLTGDQTAKVEKINLTYAEKKKAIMDKMHQEMKALHKSQDEEINAVLTPDQQAKYKTKKEEHKKEFQNRKGPHKDCKK